MSLSKTPFLHLYLVYPCPMPMLSSLVKVDVHAICFPSLQKTLSISLNSHNLKDAELYLQLYYLP
jgi:hypothetical protein